MINAVFNSLTRTFYLRNNRIQNHPKLALRAKSKELLEKAKAKVEEKISLP